MEGGGHNPSLIGAQSPSTQTNPRRVPLHAAGCQACLLPGLAALNKSKWRYQLKLQHARTVEAGPLTPPAKAPSPTLCVEARWSQLACLPGRAQT